MYPARHLLGRAALALAMAALAACTTPPRPDLSRPGESGVISGWVTTGTFQ